MIRFYGKAQAFSLARHYAGQATATGNCNGDNRWAAVAAMIGESIELDQQFGKLTRT